VWAGGVTEGEVRTRLEAQAGSAEPLPPLSVVGLLTRDRIGSVARALASFRENARRHGQRPQFVVADIQRYEDGVFPASAC
jgi:hypothetical protein